MQRIALLFVLLGIIFLASYMELSEHLIIKNQRETKDILENQKVYVESTVIKESQTTYYRVLILKNNLTINCECNNIPNLIGKRVEISGIIDNFQNNKIRVLKIRWK